MPARFPQIIAVLVCLIQMVTAQTPVPVPMEGAPESAQHKLDRYHIDRNKESLARALHDPRDEVRGLAALELTHYKQKDTVSELEMALKSETSPGNQIAIALALVELDRDTGITVLIAMCNDRSKSTALRLQAAQRLLSLHNEAGLPGIIEAMHAENPERNSVPLADLLRFLPEFKNPPQSAIEDIREPASVYLASGQLPVRAAAGQALAAYGDASSIEKFDTAIASEHEQTVKEALVADRDSLERKLQTVQQ